jgi:Carboxypeptidase regulatory-like domain
MSFFKGKVLLFSLMLLIGACFVSQTNAQGISTIRGTVTNDKGEVVVGATVTLKNDAKGFTRTLTTNSDGQFTFASIPPDTYTLSIESSGFKKYVNQNVQAAVDTIKDITAALEIGQITQTVDVSTSGDPTLNTTNATLGNTITSQQVIELPLSGRNTAALLSLQPGVTTDGSVNGGRRDQANVTLDGVDVNEQQGGRAFYSVLRVTPEELQEFRVTTTNADANVGRSSGAQISLITRSGSNKWGGSGYIYYRPSTKFQANNYFNNIAGVKIPSVQRKNIGGSFSGPIKKDRIFFFASYESFREATETSVTRQVPLASLGQGTVKYLYSGSAVPNAACSPTVSGGVASLTASQINTCYTLANGVTPGVNNAGLAVLAAAAGKYTANDTTVGDGLNTSGYRFNAKTPVKNNAVTLRLDGKLTDSQDVFLRVKSQYDNSTSAPRFPGTPAPNNWVHPWGIATGHTWTINSSVVNKLTYGFTRDSFTTGGDANQNQITFRFIYQPLSYSRELSRITPVHNILDDVTWVKGNHTISAGVNFRFVKNQRTSFASAFDNASMNPSFYANSGDVVTVSTAGSQIFPNVSGASSVNLRDALTSVIGRYSQFGVNLQYDADGKLLPAGSGVKRTFKTEEFEWYLQDSYRVQNNLTVNYGVRWSTSTPVYEANGLQVAPVESLSTFFEKRVQGAYFGTPYNGLITVDKAGKKNGKPGYYEQDWNNFAPTISAAWSPNFKNGFLKTIFGGEGKSTIRGGFRMTYDRIGSALAVAFDLNSTLGFSSTAASSANQFNVTDRLGPLFTSLGQDFRGFAGVTVPATLKFPLQTPADEAERIEGSLDSKLKTPYNYNFNLSFGREIGKGITFEVSYVGRIARGLLVSRDTATFNNLRDPISGQDFYGVMRTLLDLRSANTPITAIGTIPWANKFLSGLAGNYSVCGVTTALTASQAAYRRVARATVNNAATGNCIGGRNTQDYTFVQTLWDDGLGAGNNIFVHPQYATFAAYSTIGTSDYHSAQFSIRKRFSQGLGFDFNYTYAHSLDTASGTESSTTLSSGASLILNPYDLNLNRGSSDFDVRHLINANFIYQLPFGKDRKFFGGINKLANAFLGGWQLTGIYRWNTGFPIGEPFDDGRWATNWNVQSNGVRIKDTETSFTPSGVGGLPNLFANPTAIYQSFRNAYPGEAGDRNVFREPNYVTFDAGLYKSFSFKESHKVTLRLEVFNVTNTQRLTSLANRRLGVDPYLNGTPSNDFGRLTAIQGSPRIVQMAVRYDF